TPARFTGALLDAAQARGAKLHIGVVGDVARRDGAVAGVMTADGQTLDGDAVVLAMGPWTGRMAARLSLPRVYGLKGYSVTLAAPDVPAHALFVDSPTGHGPWGILNAPATGLALAELIADGAASLVDLRAFDPARLRARA